MQLIIWNMVGMKIEVSGHSTEIEVRTTAEPYDTSAIAGDTFEIEGVYITAKRR